MGESTSPISVILVSSGSRGNKLLFRFPFQRGPEHPAAQAGKPRSRYAVNSTNDNTEDQDGDSRFSDVILATILATKSDMCGKKFELKIDNVRFVGHPTLLQHALGQANADPSVINCLHNLSRRIAIVLQHEERRCQYLTREAKLILAIQDEVSAMSETAEGPQSPFHHILPKCKLARDLKEAYDSYSPLAEEFSCQFPGHDLPSVLSKFSLPVSLSEFKNPLAPPVQETQLIQMVIWMLQHRLLIQLHTYVCLMVPPNEEDFRAQDEDMPFTARVGGRSLSTPNALSFGSPTSSDDMTLTSPSMDNSSAELIPGGDSPLNKRMTENLLASLSEHEREAILNVPAAQNPEDLRMFARLLHYFRGRHHLEEIMYNENMRRSQLVMLFDKFRSVLVVTNHEDPVISVFQSLLK
ncbi:GATOR1 complex protein NPRL3 isoform X16 [Chrysemys picta bellii]|uniref:GATOR1 complex protein NPRL3 isoform X16 n=1 Tax=Chrysemys picta bellii TaxID=8478 RepID=UPI0032B14535